jgi:putative peptidoglycan lipid II flippase
MTKLNKIEKLIPGAVLLGISSLLSRLLGIFRDRVIAGEFGASKGVGIFDIDVYYAAFRLPDFLFAILIVGAVSTAFVPIFSGYVQKKDMKNAWAFANNCLNLITIAMLGLAIIAFIFAPFIVKILTPGFSAEKLALTAKITRIMLLSPIFFTFSAIAQSIENTFRKFFYYALAPIFYNLSIIVFTYYFSDIHGIYATTAGVIVGALLHFLIQLPAIIKLGFRYRPIFDYKRKDFIEMIKLLVPRILSISSTQINLIVETLIASTLATGSVAVLSYAFNLNSLPMGIIGISIAIATFSTLSMLASEDKKDELIKTVRKNLSNILLLIIPSTVGLILLRQEIVELILGTGKFIEKDITLTANALGFFAIGLIGQASIPFLARVFYAFKNTKTPMKITLVIVLINVILSVVLTFKFKYGVYGIAFAGGIAHFIGFIMFIWALNKNQIKNILDFKKIFGYVVLSGIMGVIVYSTKNLSDILSINILISVLAGAGFYLLFVKILNLDKQSSIS